MFFVVGSLVMEYIPAILKIILFVFPVGLIILTLYMLFERYEEIKGGEEDDLSKY